MSTVWNKLIDASLKMQNELEELSLTKHIHPFLGLLYPIIILTYFVEQT